MESSNNTYTPWEQLPIEEQLLSYISDQHKSVYGFRPDLTKYRHMTEDQLQEELNQLNHRLEEEMVREVEREKEDVNQFKKLVQDTIKLGAGDEQTALRWLTSEINIQSSMDTEQFVWSKGILHTEYGRELVDKLNQIHLN